MRVFALTACLSHAIDAGDRLVHRKLAQYAFHCMSDRFGTFSRVSLDQCSVRKGCTQMRAMAALGVKLQDNSFGIFYALNSAHSPHTRNIFPRCLLMIWKCFWRADVTCYAAFTVGRSATLAGAGSLCDFLFPATYVQFVTPHRMLAGVQLGFAKLNVCRSGVYIWVLMLIAVDWCCCCI